MSDVDFMLKTYAERAYLEYALAVVKGRALPDVADGNKPVQRRILFAMHELKLIASAKHVKSARVVGEILGKYHPHGDSSVYEAMVRMAQPFSLRYPLVDGQGNFGSRDGDGAAAMRYTEAKLTRYADLLLSELHMGTVDFKANYDGSFMEPSLLPARLPFMLLNGGSGIAVGMATNLPSHNLTEIGNAAIFLMENPGATLDQLMAIVPAPDFPTGGVILSTKEELAQMYKTGYGPVRCSGTWTKEELARGQWQLVITSLPYGVSTSSFMTELDKVLNPVPGVNKKSLSQPQLNAKQVGLDLIEKVVDESTGETPIRIVISPKTAKVSQDQLVSFLIANTSLETNFVVNSTFIGMDGRPCTKGLLDILTEWCEFRVQTVRRRTEWEKAKAEARLHILEGRHIVFLNLDKVIKIIREADDPKAELKAAFSLSDIQADNILEMRLAQLNKLEGLKLEKEMDELRAEIARLSKLLASDKLLRKLIVKELQQDVAQYGDTRLSQWQPKEKRTEAVAITSLVPDEEVTLVLSNNLWIRGYKGNVGPENYSFKKEDSLRSELRTRTVHPTLVLAADGRVFTLDTANLPSSGRTDGVPLSTLVTLSGTSTPVGLFGADTEWLLWHDKGYGLRVKGSAAVSKLKAGKSFLTVKEGEAVQLPTKFAETAHVFIRTSDNHVLLFPANELNLSDKGGRGQQLVSLSAGAKILALELLSDLNDPVANLGRALSKDEVSRWMGSRGKKGKKTRLS